MEDLRVPIYEYQCSKCGETFEAFQKVSDDPLKECRFCGGKVEKLISQSSFQLKGSGWYLTDYARKTSGGTAQDKPKTDADSSKAVEKPKTSTQSGSTESK
jgi:putative FmdB family regulatory protein